MKNRFTALVILLLFAWMAVMVYLSDQQGLEALPFLQKLKLLPNISDKDLADDLEYIVRKSAHLVEYAILYILVYLAASRVFFKKNELRLAQALLFSLIFCFFFAVSDEAHQFFVPSRDGRISDIFIDMFGVLLGQGLVLLGILVKQLQHK